MNPAKTESTAVAVFARAPVPGFAKTRLIPCLGPEAAAKLQTAFIKRTLQTALAARLGPIYLFCTPDCAHPLFERCRNAYGLTLCQQSGGDLGERMFSALSKLCPHPNNAELCRNDGGTQNPTASYVLGPALLIGTDCPALTSLHLRKSAQALQEGDDAVLLPAEDGGYVLVGLQRAEPSLFTDIPWSGSEVMAITRQRLRQIGLCWREPATLWDVDRPEDMVRLRASGLMKDIDI